MVRFCVAERVAAAVGRIAVAARIASPAALTNIRVDLIVPPSE
jgi:hypothetical protein